ncbi:PAS domain-containing protein [Marinobacter nauticus]
MVNTHAHPNAESHERLRRSARNLIDQGVPPPNHGGSLSVDALQLLYQRANAPDSAADALKLLHELQTYQVEIDLLYEQLQENEQEATERLAYYKALFEQAPVAFLTVTSDGAIVEANQAAEVVLGTSTLALTGTPLVSLLAAGQEKEVAQLLTHAQSQGPNAQALPQGSLELAGHRRLAITTRTLSAGDHILMALTETPTHL